MKAPLWSSREDLYEDDLKTEDLANQELELRDLDLILRGRRLNCLQFVRDYVFYLAPFFTLYSLQYNTSTCCFS